MSRDPSLLLLGNKQTVVHLQQGLPLSNKKEQITDLPNNLNESEGYYAERKRPRHITPFLQCGQDGVTTEMAYVSGGRAGLVEGEVGWARCNRTAGPRPPPCWDSWVSRLQGCYTDLHVMT